jgi:hypothetical protein
MAINVPSAEYWGNQIVSYLPCGGTVSMGGGNLNAGVFASGTGTDGMAPGGAPSSVPGGAPNVGGGITGAGGAGPPGNEGGGTTIAPGAGDPAGRGRQTPP